MPDPVDISTFPRAFDTSLFTPREAEAYEAAWCDRRLAVAALTAAMRGDDDEQVADLLGPALAAAHRCNAIEEAAAERIQMDADRAARPQGPGTPDPWLAALRHGAARFENGGPQLVIGPPVDGDRASENDLAARGYYDDVPWLMLRSDLSVAGVNRTAPESISAGLQLADRIGPERAPHSWWRRETCRGCGGAGCLYPECKGDHGAWDPLPGREHGPCADCDGQGGRLR